MKQNNSYKLITHGFELINMKKDNIFHLNKIKNLIRNYASNEINTNNIKLEKIHLKNEKIDDFNIFRLNIIKKINENQIIQNLLFQILSDKLYKLFGTDISVQKNINLVIQRPDDDSRAIIHTDAPPESPYQVNFWIPLVDCKNTMSMYFFTPDKNGKIGKFLNSKNYQSSKMDLFSKKTGVNPNVKYGQYVIFSPETWHHPPINKEENTRWAINIRYKNTFSPYGKKGFLDYYKPISFSDITTFTLENEKK